MERCVDLRPYQEHKLPDGVGRDILVPRRQGVTEYLNLVKMAELIDSDPRQITFNAKRMSNNVALGEPFKTDGVMSAYYTYIPKSHWGDPQQTTEAVVVEWGKVIGGERKVHDQLRRVIADYTERTKENGMLLRSGHLTKILGRDIYLALIDGIPRRAVPADAADYSLVRLLQQNNYLVIAANGEPIQIQRLSRT